MKRNIPGKRSRAIFTREARHMARGLKIDHGRDPGALSQKSLCGLAAAKLRRIFVRYCGYLRLGSCVRRAFRSPNHQRTPVTGH